MINISQQAMQYLQDGGYQRGEIYLYDPSDGSEIVSFTNNSIIPNTLTVQKSCSSNGSLELGAMVSDQLQVRVKTDSATAKGLKGAKIVLGLSLEVEPMTMEYKVVFSGVVTEVKRVSSAIYQITALDGMIVFDVPFHASEITNPFNGNPLSYPVSAVMLFKSIIYSKAEPYLENELSQGSPIEPDPFTSPAIIEGIDESQGYTCRQILKWCAQVMGVNVRVGAYYDIVAGKYRNQLETWLWDFPQSISTWSDYYDPPYGIDGSNAYSIQDNDDEMGTARFMVKAGSSILYDTGTPNNEQGVISIEDNPILNGLYQNYPNMFNAYCNAIRNRVQYYPAPVGHITGSVKATPRWWLQPGDIVGVMQNGQGVWMIPVNITHKLNGATTFEAGTQAIESTETSGSTPSFSPEQNNELTARFQDICWYPGESYTGNAFAHGYVTHGRDRLQLTFPLKKIFSPQTTKVNISSLIISLRVPTGGYIKSDGFNATQYITGKSVFGNSLHLTLDMTNDTWFEINNVPVCGEVQISMQVR